MVVGETHHFRKPHSEILKISFNHPLIPPSMIISQGTWLPIPMRSLTSSCSKPGMGAEALLGILTDPQKLPFRAQLVHGNNGLLGSIVRLFLLTETP